MLNVKMFCEKWLFSCCGVFIIFLFSPVYPQAASAELERHRVFNERERLLEIFSEESEDAVADLTTALNHDQGLVRRTAAHLLVRLGEPALEGVEQALESSDVRVRHIAVCGLAEKGIIEKYLHKILLDDHPFILRQVRMLLEERAIDEDEDMDMLIDNLIEAYQDAESAVREQMVRSLVFLDIWTDESMELLVEAASDDDRRVREAAYEQIVKMIDAGWEEAPRLLQEAQEDESDFIRDIGLEMRWKLLQVKEMRFPEKGWRFRLDPEGKGREEGWYDPNYDDSDWRTDIPIEANWNQFFDQRYAGAAWYRRPLQVGEFPDGDKVYLDFRGVDEEGWVWINGEFAGAHTLGTSGWNIPFQLDVTDLVRPGETNHVAVRVENTAAQGGIWRPVYLRVIDSKILE